MKFNILDSDIEEVHKCQVCNSNNFDTISSVSVDDTVFFNTSICNDCGLFFRSLRPNLNWLTKCWGIRDNYQKSKGIVPIDKEVERNRIQRYLSLEKLLSEYVSEKRVLDIGSGTGGGLKAFKDKGWKVVGIEPDSSRARYGISKYNINTIVDIIENVDINDKFPMVTMIHSLEHFYDPISKVKLVKEFVKEGGYIYIEVPDALTHVLDWSDSFFLGHFSNFMEYNLMLLGINNGLTPIIRTYPKSKKHGVENLGILFKNDNMKHNDGFISMFGHKKFDKHKSNVLSRYYSNRRKKTKTLHLSIPEINDLSVGYKDISELNKFDVVRSNCLSYDNDDTYSVESCKNMLGKFSESIKSFSFRVFYIKFTQLLKKYFNINDNNFINIRYKKL